MYFGLDLGASLSRQLVAVVRTKGLFAAFLISKHVFKTSDGVIEPTGELVSSLLDQCNINTYLKGSEKTIWCLIGSFSAHLDREVSRVSGTGGYREPLREAKDEIAFFEGKKAEYWTIQL